MTLIHTTRNRGITKNIVVQDGRGNTITLGDSDVIRFILGREGKLDSSPLLTVTSATPTDNGSSFQKNIVSGTNQLRLDASDLAGIAAGVYTASFDYFDASDSNEWKLISRQVFVVEAT